MNNQYSFYKRFDGPTHGFCRLCGKNQQLSYDHIPPSVWNDTRNIELRSFPYNEQKTISKKGLMFRTICSNCNNKLLGSLDNEIGVFITDYLNHLCFMDRERIQTQKVRFKITKENLLKGLVGHFIAGFDPVSAVTNPLDYKNKSYKNDLRKFWQSEILKFRKNISIYYWTYLSNKIIFAPQIVYIPNLLEKESIIICSIIKVYPIAFMICDLCNSKYRFNLPTISMNKIKKHIELSLEFNMLSDDYPFQQNKNTAILYNPDLLYYGLNVSNIE